MAMCGAARSGWSKGQRSDDQANPCRRAAGRKPACRLRFPKYCPRGRQPVPSGSAPDDGDNSEAAGERGGIALAARTLGLEWQWLCLATRRVRARRRPWRVVPDRLLAADSVRLALGEAALDQLMPFPTARRMLD